MSALDEARMLAELAKLPDPELLQASQITDPIGADAFYSGRTVVELLTAERERLHAALDEAADMLAHENEQLRRLSSLDAMRAGKLAEDVERYSALHARLFAEKTAAQIKLEGLREALFRLWPAVEKAMAGLVFTADRAGDVAADMSTIRAAIVPEETAPGCKTPAGCRENGCLGWCDEHKPEAAKP